MGFFKDQFDKQGYTIIKNFKTLAQIAEIETVMDQFLTDHLERMPNEHVFYEEKSDKTTLKQLQHLDRYHPFFKEIFQDGPLVDLAEQLLGSEVTAKNMQWFNKPPKIGKGTPPHQDGYYFMLEPNEALTMWLAIDDVNEENGCIRYLPGSHKKGMRPHSSTGILGFSQGIMDFSDVDETLEVPMIVQSGDLLIHHSLTVHRANANTSLRTRKGLGFIFYSKRAKQNRIKHETYQEKLREELVKSNKI